MPECRRCGQCCNLATLVLHHVKRNKDHMEFARFLSYHHLETYWVKVQDGGPEVLAVKLPLTCEHLSMDEATGLAQCGIYEHRPVICRLHECSYVKRGRPERPGHLTAPWS